MHVKTLLNFQLPGKLFDDRFEWSKDTARKARSWSVCKFLLRGRNPENSFTVKHLWQMTPLNPLLDFIFPVMIFWKIVFNEINFFRNLTETSGAEKKNGFYKNTFDEWPARKKNKMGHKATFNSCRKTPWTTRLNQHSVSTMRQFVVKEKLSTEEGKKQLSLLKWKKSHH